MVIYYGFSTRNLNSADCDTVKTGEFYFYPSNSKDSYHIIRKKNEQIEINLRSKDTSFWQLTWLAKCTASLKFKKGTNVPPTLLEFMQNHTTVIEIKEITPKYYVFTANLDSLNSPFAKSDTVWRVRK